MSEVLTVELSGVGEDVRVDWASFDRLVEDLSLKRKLAECRAASRRLVVGICGPSACGKTLFSEVLKRYFNDKCGVTAVAVSGDGYHLTNAELKKRGLRARKGMPETMDYVAFGKDVTAMKSGLSAVSLPIYDRQIHDVRYDVIGVPPLGAEHSPEVVIAEGLWVAHWPAFRKLVDLCLYFESSLSTARRRIIKRKTNCGVSEKEAAAKFQTLDTAITRVVRESKRFADAVIRTEPPQTEAKDAVTELRYVVLTSNLKQSSKLCVEDSYGAAFCDSTVSRSVLSLILGVAIGFGLGSFYYRRRQ